MSENRHKNGPPARLARLAGLLAFVVLMAVICLLSPGSPLRAAPKLALLGGPTYVGGIIDTDTTWPNFLMERVGVVVLRTADAQKNADQLRPESASFRESAVILADADQLETLARLCFEPRGTDERGLAERDLDQNTDF